MFTITVRLDEKRSTTSQYENKTVGVLLEAQNLELNSRDDIMKKAREMFALATAAVNQQFHQEAIPPQNGNGHENLPQSNGASGPRNPTDNSSRWNNGSSHGSGNGNDRRRSYGRPDPEPTPKQRLLLKRIARDRHLGPESIRDIAERIVGKRIEEMDRRDMSMLLESLIEGEAA